VFKKCSRGGAGGLGNAGLFGLDYAYFLEGYAAKQEWQYLRRQAICARAMFAIFYKFFRVHKKELAFRSATIQEPKR